MTDPKRLAHHSWLNAERDCRYWAHLSAGAEKVDSWLNLFVGTFSGAALLSLILNLGLPDPWPKIIPGGFALLSAGLTVFNRQMGYAKKSARYAMQHGMCLQRIESWKRVRDVVMDGGTVPEQLVIELRLRDEAMLAYEAGHKQDDKVLKPICSEVRKLEALYREQWKQRRQRKKAANDEKAGSGTPDPIAGTPGSPNTST